MVFLTKCDENFIFPQTFILFLCTTAAWITSIFRKKIITANQWSADWREACPCLHRRPIGLEPLCCSETVINYIFHDLCFLRHWAKYAKVEKKLFIEKWALLPCRLQTPRCSRWSIWARQLGPTIRDCLDKPHLLNNLDLFLNNRLSHLQLRNKYWLYIVPVLKNPRYPSRYWIVMKITSRVTCKIQPLHM